MFLSGNFAPVRDELDSSNLETTGKIPSDLKGMFVRVGPNPKFHPIAEYHWYAAVRVRCHTRPTAHHFVP